ncbi:MAG TPA: ECF transporter S component [Thermoclostridium caenicola]|uniref:Uncharacterized membrane protein n=1 Tax=Thermoclostridium caenicola TaxID=659425 RepID=A0A1M6EAR1_9FIRM|nr:ECF transporter S component [Thermoclostridium caenicola]SHI82459.1 Uncharacterized membrane protein [Thermoclostridium caenicola]HOK43322.1 ECF transporter S component [Thermoclostridium caenicola]HOL85357.1 ECF transporter S component [Thermoclostridium caenicola]HPO76887.1 ECF transporter S component [Thermoclostridium caenicola]HPU21770.1 ECF transporter S component [Thermoclostridium caenicola]
MENIQSRPRISVRRIAVAGIFSALTIVLTLIPSLGYIPIPPFSITTMHIPVIIAAVLDGPLTGAFVGLMFGLSSLYTAATIFSGMPVAPFFLNPLVSVVPRILIGLAAYYVFAWLNKLVKNKTVSIIGAALGGTLTNTVGVLGMIYVLYAQQYVEAVGATTAGKSALAIIFSGAFLNMLVEIAAASLISVPVVLALQRFKK